VVELLLILVVAIGGKFLGALAAARLAQVSHRQAAALGVLMNTRGLTEIVILQVGLQLGVLDTRLFTLMVFMAIITTVMTEPLLRRVYPERIVARDIAEAERAELGAADSFGVLVSVPEGTDDGDGRRLAALASALVGAERPARIVLARLLPTPRVPLELASGLGSDLLTITHAGQQLRDLAPRPDEGLHHRVVARFSASPAGDVAALARDVRADVVVVPEPPEAGEVVDLPDVGEAALVLVRPATAAQASTAVHVLLDGTGAGRAAARLAGRLALHLGAPIAVGVTDDGDRRSARRATATVYALRRLGLAATELAEPATAPALLVLPEGVAVPPTAGWTTVVRVRPAPSDEDDDLQQVLARIPVPG